MNDVVIPLRPKDMLVPTDSKPFEFINAQDLAAQPQTENWLISGVLPADSLCLLFGEPGAGKSLFSLDFAFCLAAGIDWEGRKTRQSKVAYIAGEGHAGLGKRLKALESKYSITTPSGFVISRTAANFSDLEDARAVAKGIKECLGDAALIIIDTLHRNFQGDENSAKDVAIFVQNIGQAFAGMTASVLIVHHSGLAAKERARGSSSLKAAVDCELSAIKNDDAIVLSCTKSKDYEAFEPLRFALRPVDLPWVGEGGESLTSVYLEANGVAKPKEPKKQITACEQFLLTSLHDATRDKGIEPTTEIKGKFSGFDNFKNKGRQVVTVDNWRPYAYKAIPISTDNAKKRVVSLRQSFFRNRKSLIDKKIIVEFDGFVWVLFDD